MERFNLFAREKKEGGEGEEEREREREEKKTRKEFR